MSAFKQETNIIDQLYVEERHRQAEEQTYPELNARVRASDFALIKALEARFNTTSDLLIREAISHALKDMFARLEPMDRKKLAKEADELDQQISEQQAEQNDVSDYQAKPSATWVTFDRALTRLENKNIKQKNTVSQSTTVQKTKKEDQKSQANSSPENASSELETDHESPLAQPSSSPSQDRPKDDNSEPVSVSVFSS